MPFVLKIILTLTLLFFSVGSSQAAPITIHFEHAASHDSAKGKASEYFKRLVEQRSNKRIEVQINAVGSSRGQSPLKALQDNRAQMAAPDIFELYDLAPQMRIFEVPFLFNGPEHLHKVIDSPVGTELLRTVSQNGIRALSFWDKGFHQITANQPLTRPQQLKSLRFQVLQSNIFKEQLKRFGAQPQTIPQQQLYSALEENRVDGQENTLVNIYENKYHQVQSDLTISNHSYAGSLVIANSFFWSQLPDDLKVIVKGAIQDATEYTRDIAKQMHDDAYKRIKASGLIKIHLLSRRERQNWAQTFSDKNPESDNRVNNDFVHKARKMEIR